ncbi:MAG: hypothetical protein LBU23_10560, partial [Planctomycetota bacterium]|nr:hypothetical protein [Planctomycetota bacterium]
MSSLPDAESHLWRAINRSPTREDPPKGLDSIWHKLSGVLKRRVHSPRKYLARANRILARESQYAKLGDARLREEAEKIRHVMYRSRETPADVDAACAIIREGAKRVFGFRHHAVQIAGALSMYDGCIAEMATGEGKTLTATVPATLAAWRGRGCHVITVNDYLAGRDAEEMGKLYSYFHLKAKAISQESEPEERSAAYAADITYLTNKEAAADYLRDRLALGDNKNLTGYILAGFLGKTGNPGSKVVQRGLEFAIIDEVDSVLVDEAVTPLIISSDGHNEERENSFLVGKELADSLGEKEDYAINWKYKEIELTLDGKRRLRELVSGKDGIWKSPRRSEEIVHQALTARYFFREGSEYILDEGKVVIVDEATGRLMPDRSWRDGLHQAVETKEGVEMTPDKVTMARISFQRFFRLYQKLSGMTGTGKEAVGEFWHVYHLPVVPIPTHRPCKRIMRQPKICSSQTAKWDEVIKEIQCVHAEGRPILVGTRSIQANEHLSSLLAKAGLEHQVLNAIHHKREAEIVARAGQKGGITVATNMAGRGTDIKLQKESEAL